MATATEYEYGLTSFIQARLDDREAEFDQIGDFLEIESARGPGWGNRGDCPLCGAYAFDGTESVTKDAAWEHLEEVHHRSRELQEIAFQRWLLRQHGHEFFLTMPPKVGGCHSCLVHGIQKVRGWCPTVAALGAIWKDHADYQAEWAPKED